MEDAMNSRLAEAGHMRGPGGENQRRSVGNERGPVVAGMSDEQLYGLCKAYGENARYWKRKFMGLLPEVFRRRLYLKKKFNSIFDFALKIGGMSENQTRLVLNLERQFADKPTLQSLLTEGKVGVNKLVRVASVATAENEKFWAEKVRVMSQRAIETFVRDEKAAGLGGGVGGGGGVMGSGASGGDAGGFIGSGSGEIAGQNPFNKPLFAPESLRAQRFTSSPLEVVKLKIDDDVLKELLTLQEKNININNLLREMLKNRESGIEGAKEESAKEQIARAEDRELQNKPASRYMSVGVRRLIDSEQGDKCAVPGCGKPAQVLHHELPFAMAKTHDPRYLKKLCKAHHEIRHKIDVKFSEIGLKGGGSG